MSDGMAQNDAVRLAEPYAVVVPGVALGAIS
jgi:hypothetical protein